MLKNLISLVFLLIAFHYTYSYPDTSSVILPKTKPKELSIAIKKEKLSTILPAKKPQIKMFGWRKSEKMFVIKSFFNKAVVFWSTAKLQKSTTKKLFYLKHFFTFPPIKHFNLRFF